MPSPKPICESSRYALIHLFVFSVLTSFAIYLFAVLHTYSKPADSGTTMPISAVHGWIYLQSTLILTPAVLLGVLIARARARLGSAIGMIAVGTTALAYVLDVVAYNAVRERLFSDTTAKVLWVLLPGLISNINDAMIVMVLVSVTVVTIYFFAAYYGSAFLATRIVQDDRDSSLKQVIAILSCILIGLAAVPIYRGSLTVDEMRASSDRHPLCLTCMIGHISQGAPSPSGQAAVAGAIRAIGAIDRIDQVEIDYSRLRVTPPIHPSPPDILLVVIESFRREVIQQSITPNLYALAQRGVWAQNHFSTSNATNMGMFSALYGLEPVWFDRGLHWKPALNEIFSQANYELGFFGGSMEWELFRMDTFIHPDLYDQFAISPVAWTDSDISMRDKTVSFLSKDDTDSVAPRRPRLAVLYLYSTHFDYHSEPEDQHNQPAATGQLTTAYGPSNRDEVWNRYLNSARFIDRILAPLLTEDRIIAVIGDHGEAFLEDECRLHGIRITEFQNATPAIIAGPGIAERQIKQLTSHVDILPTLLDAANISVDGLDVLEGASILDPALSSDRLLVTRNYMKPEVAILGNWTENPSKPFGHRVYFSIDQWQASPANPIDRFGMELRDHDDFDGLSTSAVFDRWLQMRFGDHAMKQKEDPVPSLQQFLNNPRREIVLEALKLSGQVGSKYFSRLMPSVAELSASTDDEIRKTAQNVWLEMQRQVK